MLENWHSQPLYQQYFTVRPTPAGNLLFQFVLAGMMRVASPAVTERLLLTAYILLFAAAFLLLVRTVSPNWPAFSLFGFIFLANNFYQTGFWNFVFSIPLMLLALTYYLHGRARRTPWWFAMLTVWGLAVYEMHMGSWMVFGITLGVFSAGDLWMSYRKRSGLAGRAIAPLYTLLPPLVLTAAFMTGSGYRSVSAGRLAESLTDRVKPLAALSFFRSLSDADLVFTAAFGVLATGMAAGALWRRRAGWTWLAGDVWLAVAACCAAGSVLAPSAASGVFLRHRLAFYAWMFLVLWLATERWSPRVVRGCAVCAGLLAALPFIWRMPEYNRWEGAITELASAGPHVRAGSAILALDMQDQWHRINPLLHAVDLFAPKPFIDLRDYEAATAYFPTQFRPGRNPFESLGTLDELQHMPPVFDLRRYEAETHAKVDYLLFYGTKANDSPERRLYGDDLASYQLVYVSQPAGLARLYLRVR